jgi:tetratricopeptide (TPR) repeat protein
MNKNSKIITIIFFSITTIFLCVVFFFFTLIPNIKVIMIYNDLVKVANGDTGTLPQIGDIMDNTDPDISFKALDFLLNNYQYNKDIKEENKRLLISFVVDKISNNLSLKIKYPDQLIVLGRAYDLMAQWDQQKAQGFLLKAEEQYKKALIIYPYNQKILYAYSINLINQGRDEEAIKMAQEAVNEDPRVAESHYYLGVLLAKQNINNADSVLSEIEITLNNKIDPNNEVTKPIYEKLLSFYYNNRNINKLLIVIKRLIIIDPTQTETYQNIANYIETKKQIPVLKISD